MKSYIVSILLIISACVWMGSTVRAQPTSKVKGKLFIIGGGTRSSALVGEMVRSAALNEQDYIVILPMATSVPEESIAGISEQIREHSTHPIVAFNFSREDASQRLSWIDSVRQAKLIYVTGGDQNKFMNVVRGTPLYEALHAAFQRGATIAGTSAGAAIMSEVMITGNILGKDSGNFNEVKAQYVETTSGMGFIRGAIIDQHFIARSRYNRLLSVLADYPKLQVIGIDEGTAILVHGRKARVVGDSQVVFVAQPKQLLRRNTDQKASFSKAKLGLYVEGQVFNMNP